MLNRSIRRCSVYDGHGECCGQSLDLDGGTERDPADDAPPAANCVPLREIMTPDVVCARADLEIAAVVALMIHHHIGCLPIVDDRWRPIGVITKYDIVEHLDTAMRAAASGGAMPAELAARTANDLMMPLAMVLDESASIGRAAALMIVEDLHHILVVNELGHLVGIVSTRDITNWMVENDKAVI